MQESGSETAHKLKDSRLEMPICKDCNYIYVRELRIDKSQAVIDRRTVLKVQKLIDKGIRDRQIDLHKPKKTRGRKKRQARAEPKSSKQASKLNER